MNIETKEFYGLLAKDPSAAHERIIRAGRKRELMEFTSRIIRTVPSIPSLAISPSRPNDIGYWKIVAKCLSGNIVDSGGVHESEAREIQGAWEQCFNMRSACMVYDPQKKPYLRGACIARKDKIPGAYLPGMTKIVKMYNDHVKRQAKAGRIEFKSIGQWMNEHPELKEIWLRSVRARENKKEV